MMMMMMMQASITLQVQPTDCMCMHCHAESDQHAVSANDQEVHAESDPRMVFAGCCAHEEQSEMEPKYEELDDELC
jgi:uncharacterized CHY-type Zn-finger protein